MVQVEGYRWSRSLIFGTRMEFVLVKIVIVGAGSAVFSKNLIANILAHEALPGADFVTCAIGVGGIDAVKDDLEVPLKFGIINGIVTDKPYLFNGNVRNHGGENILP